MQRLQKTFENANKKWQMSSRCHQPDKCHQKIVKAKSVFISVVARNHH